MAATATSKPEVPGPGDKCGDGTCDEAEQKDPSLCPQDCAETAVTLEVTPPEATPPEAAPAPQPTSTEAAAGRETMTSPAGETAFVGDPTTVSQEGGEAVGPRQANLAVILDASGSMNEALPGVGKTKLAVAKEVMAELIPLIPGEMNGSLWIYGHRHSADPKSESCQDIEQVYGLGPVDAAAYVGQVQGISAKGYTPIADSIQQAAEALPPADFNSIILVSDGEETCGGDPCALAEALKASDSEVTIHVVGYAVNQTTKEQLQCVAQASGGSYHDATDAAGLLQALEEALAATEVETILRVEVVGPAGAEVDAVVRLYEAGTDRLVTDYSAWKDNLVPPGSYDLVVETLPHLFYRGLTLPEGSTTIVRIQLSAIHVLTPDGKEDTMTYVFDTAGTQLHFEYAGTIFLVPGTYQVSVRNSMSQPIALSAGQTVEVRLGAIQVLTPDGREDTMVYIHDTAGQQLDFGYAGTILLVPGSYQLRVNDTLSQPISLGAGQRVEFRLGVIKVAGSFELYDTIGNRLGLSRRDSALIVPGTYSVKLADGSSIENVILEAGKVTEVR
jgi:Ca-activated chloride channel family protein